MSYRICERCMSEYQDNKRDRIALKLPWRQSWVYRQPTDDIMKEYEAGRMKTGTCEQHEVRE